MAFPKTLDELKTQGYEFICGAVCNGKNCGAAIQWFETPASKRVPLDIDTLGNVTAHWATCPDREDFRKPRSKKP